MCFCQLRGCKIGASSNSLFTPTPVVRYLKTSNCEQVGVFQSLSRKAFNSQTFYLFIYSKRKQGNSSACLVPRAACPRLAEKRLSPADLGSYCLARHEGSGVAANILGQGNLPAPGPRRLLRICNVLSAINLGLVTVLNNHFVDFSLTAWLLWFCSRATAPFWDNFLALSIPGTGIIVLPLIMALAALQLIPWSTLQGCL